MEEEVAAGMGGGRADVPAAASMSPMLLANAVASGSGSLSSDLSLSLPLPAPKNGLKYCIPPEEENIVNLVSINMSTWSCAMVV